MMFKNLLVCCLKSKGKILREFKDTTYIPFGSEFSILIKNLNSVRAQVRITIDGQDATGGVSLVVKPNDTMELERFIKDGNMHEGNRFKFIERTQGIEEHRGIKIEDGLIRVEFQFEKIMPKPVVIPVIHEHHDHHYHYPVYPSYPTYRRWVTKQPDVWCSANGSPQSSVDSTYMSNELQGWRNSGEVKCSGMGAGLTSPSNDNVKMSKSTTRSVPHAFVNHVGFMDSEPNPLERARSLSVNEAGITVAGSKSEQRFNWVDDFAVTDETHVMVIKLLGETHKGEQVVEAVTVKSKPRCTSCGRINKATSSFCTDCGTALELF